MNGAVRFNSQYEWAVIKTANNIALALCWLNAKMAAVCFSNGLMYYIKIYEFKTNLNSHFAHLTVEEQLCLFFASDVDITHLKCI